MPEITFFEKTNFLLGNSKGLFNIILLKYVRNYSSFTIQIFFGSEAKISGLRSGERTKVLIYLELLLSEGIKGISKIFNIKIRLQKSRFSFQIAIIMKF